MERGGWKVMEGRVEGDGEGRMEEAVPTRHGGGKKVKVNLQQATKARRCRDIAVLFT
jgi:hypothetical protein